MAGGTGGGTDISKAYFEAKQEQIKIN
jgi:hypothetical protein